MCFQENVKTTTDKMESLRQLLLLAQQQYDADDEEAMHKTLEQLQPDLLYVTQSLLGVVTLKDVPKPYGGTMPAVDQVDEDALFHAFL